MRMQPRNKRVGAGRRLGSQRAGRMPFDFAQDKPALRKAGVAERTGLGETTAGAACCAPTTANISHRGLRSAQSKKNTGPSFVAERFDWVYAHGAPGGEIAGQQRDCDERAGGEGERLRVICF